jgi:hypothetical protein
MLRAPEVGAVAAGTMTEPPGAVRGRVAIGRRRAWLLVGAVALAVVVALPGCPSGRSRRHETPDGINRQHDVAML